VARSDEFQTLRLPTVYRDLPDPEGPEGGRHAHSTAELADTDRIAFMRSYLGELQRATAENVPVRGYFHWSVMDNFEWIAAYSNRYGLYYVDFETQARTPKLSAGYFSELARANAVV